MIFEPGISPPADPSTLNRWFVFQNYNLLVEESQEQIILPASQRLNGLSISDADDSAFFLGTLETDAGTVACYCTAIDDDAAIPEGMRLRGLRQLYGLLDEMDFWIAGRAVQVVDWDRTHRFCGRCATPTENHQQERAKVCPNCGLTSYPRLAPAIIVRVQRTADDGSRQILLGRNHRFPEGMYSVLAGFVEPGESLEACVRREILEEVNLEVDNIRYFGSQPWPFPHSLMIAFEADYHSGDIEVEVAELQDAQWFSADALPRLPSPPSIASELISAWLAVEE